MSFHFYLMTAEETVIIVLQTCRNTGLKEINLGRRREILVTKSAVLLPEHYRLRSVCVCVCVCVCELCSLRRPSQCKSKNKHPWKCLHWLVLVPKCQVCWMLWHLFFWTRLLKFHSSGSCFYFSNRKNVKGFVFCFFFASTDNRIILNK